jgi:tRNA-splicing ligase RtcB (3'-phosphate/5'-hydroxy nucleic acid ligase)
MSQPDRNWGANIQIEKVDDFTWRIPRTGPMNVDGIVFADEKLMEAIRQDKSLEQVANVACLPGIVKSSIAMPDIHWGYGFPIGGVAAFDPADGVISPGGVGYDINCGVRLLSSRIEYSAVKDRLADFMPRLFGNIPTGVGSSRKDLRIKREDASKLARQGAKWAVGQGFGSAEDLDMIEAGGTIPGADFSLVSDEAFERGRDQLGTLGSGNHFVELGYVDEIYDPRLAARIGLFPGGLTVIIHTGSRGFGHQICTDYLRTMQQAADRHHIYLPDRQLSCAPVKSDEGQRYLAAMAAGANFAFANRQVITHWVRESLEQVWGMSPREHGIRVVYDVCHNIAKFETHRIDGQDRKVVVHRKGATRSFPAGHPQVPESYRDVGQPVLVPGDMGRYSYVLVGNPESPDYTFASCCHGAGRRLSRTQARKVTRNRHIVKELRDRGIHVVASSRDTVDEEFPEAYKDVAEVVDVVHGAKLAIKVARLRPVGVIKG